MSIDGPPPREEEEEEEEEADDDQHRLWETRAAVAHLLGLCEALESVERGAGERLGNGRRPSFKGKEREGTGAAVKDIVSSHLQALHDHLTYLVTMYRRGLLKASDPPVRLPISQPPALLQTTGTPNVFRFGRRVADFIVQRDWLVKGAASPADGQEDALVKSIAVHARYLLALTSQDKEPQAAIKHLQAILAISPVTHAVAAELARSSQRRLTSLQARVSRGPTAPSQPAQPTTSRFLDPRTASPRSALGKGAASSLPFPQRLGPSRPAPSVSTTHTVAAASLSPGSPSASAQDSLPVPRARHASAPPNNGSLSAAGPSSFNPDGANGGGGGGGFTTRMRRATSTFSNMTANSVTSLSPSLFSLKLQDERSEPAPSLVDDLLVHGLTAGPSSSASSSSSLRVSPWTWFGRRSAAEGSLRSLASANGRVASPPTRSAPPRATKSSRPPIPSSLKPSAPAASTSARVADSVPPSPVSGAASGTTTPSAFKTRAEDHGDRTLDPQLRQLEMSSKVTRMAACSVCGTEGVNLPECPRCRLLFCSRACRIGEDAAGDGRKHICGLLESRREAAAAAA